MRKSHEITKGIYEHTLKQKSEDKSKFLKGYLYNNETDIADFTGLSQMQITKLENTKPNKKNTIHKVKKK